MSSFDLQVKSGGTYYTMSPYVRRVSDVPYVERNRNWELKTTPITAAISYNADGAKLQKDNLVNILLDAGEIWGGFISRVDENEDAKTYEVEAKSRLELLKNYLLDYDTLYDELLQGALGTSFTFTINGTEITTSSAHGLSIGDAVVFQGIGTNAQITKGISYYVTDVISTTIIEISATRGGADIDFYDNSSTNLTLQELDETKFCGSDNTGYQNILVSYIIETMFTIVGLTINLPNGTTVIDSTYTPDLSLNRIAIDPSVLFGINQDNASDFVKSSPSFIDKASKITFYDFYRACCSAFLFYNIYTGENEYTAYRGSIGSDYFTVGVDITNVYSYKKEDRLPNYSSYTFSQFYGDEDAADGLRGAYHQSATEFNLKEIDKFGSGGQSVNFYNNFTFLVRSSSPTYPGELLAANNYWIMSVATSSGRAPRSREASEAPIHEEIRTDIVTTAKGVLENYFELVGRKSIIVQERYS